MKLIYSLLFIIGCAYGMTDEIWRNIQEHTVNKQKELAIVVPSYNNEMVCLRNLQSLLSQDYINYHVYIINDASTDRTYTRLSYFLQNHALKDQVTLINNEQRMGAMANFYNTISQLPDHVIVFIVDGDDWLPHKQVFTKVNAVYNNPNVWMTYGQFIQFPSKEIGFCKKHDRETVINNSYRGAPWLSSHLQTFYAWLFKKIKKEDFMFQGEFFSTTYDRAIMYPLLEMCAGRYKVINEVLYVYNCANPIADVRVNLSMQQKMCHYILRLPPYKPLADIVIMK